jgi:hypothetical protein
MVILDLLILFKVGIQSNSVSRFAVAAAERQSGKINGRFNRRFDSIERQQCFS